MAEDPRGSWKKFFFRDSTQNIIFIGSTYVWTLQYVPIFHISHFLNLMGPEQDFQQGARSSMHMQLPQPSWTPNLCPVEIFSSPPLSKWSFQKNGKSTLPSLRTLNRRWSEKISTQYHLKWASYGAESGSHSSPFNSMGRVFWPNFHLLGSTLMLHGINKFQNSLQHLFSYVL